MYLRQDKVWGVDEANAQTEIFLHGYDACDRDVNNISKHNQRYRQLANRKTYGHSIL